METKFIKFTYKKPTNKGEKYITSYIHLSEISEVTYVKNIEGEKENRVYSISLHNGHSLTLTQESYNQLADVLDKYLI